MSLRTATFSPSRFPPFHRLVGRAWGQRPPRPAAFHNDEFRANNVLLFRWFAGLGIADAVWDATTFTNTAIGCWRVRWRPSFSRRFCLRTSGGCREGTSRWTAWLLKA